MEDITRQTVAEVLHELGEEYVEELKERLANYDLEDSRLATSITFTVNGNVLFINMADYATFVDKGRSAGKFPPLDAIREWIKRKGIEMEDGTGDLERDAKSLSYLIGRKISEEGIEARPFIDPSPEEEIADEIAERLSIRITSQIES